MGNFQKKFLHSKNGWEKMEGEPYGGSGEGLSSAYKFLPTKKIPCTTKRWEKFPCPRNLPNALPLKKMMVCALFKVCNLYYLLMWQFVCGRK